MQIGAIRTHTIIDAKIIADYNYGTQRSIVHLARKQNISQLLIYWVHAKNHAYENL
jgi:Mor family transcriptional regulator